MSLLSISALKALSEVADQGGVTRAAEKLALSQSAVSHKIKRLEESLGCVLLNRRAGGPLLTEDGYHLLTYGRRIVSLHDEAVMSLKRAPLNGKIRIGLTEDVTSSGTARVLGRFRRMYPEVVIQITVSQSLPIEAQLMAGTLDVGVIQTFVHRTAETDVILSGDRLCWIKSPDLTLDLSQPLPYLAFGTECFYRQWMLDSGLPEGVEAETVLTCSSTTGIISAVEAGLGITIMNAKNIPAGVEIIEGILPAPPDVVFVIRKGGTHHSPVANTLIQHVADELQKPFSGIV